MRNKGFFWSITIALVLACIYQLTFSWATNRVENDSKKYAADKLDSLYANGVESLMVGGDTLFLNNQIDSNTLVLQYENEYIRSKMNEKVHFFGYTYAECKASEINLGLDLKGGMSATLEISVPDLVHQLAGKTGNKEFMIPFDIAIERANQGDDNFIDLFVEEYEKANPGVLMAKVFHMQNPDLIEADASNAETAAFLKERAINALDGVELIIEKRVNQFGVSQPTIQKQIGTNRIFVELPGVSDKATVRKKLQATASLEFYEIYENQSNGISGILANSEEALSQALFGGEIDLEVDVPVDSLNDTTEVDPTDTTKVDELLGSVENDELLTDDKTKKADSLLTDQEREERYPIRSLMNLSFEYDDNNQIVGLGQGSVVGYASIADTSALNYRLKHPAIRANLPQDLVFMWDAKEILDEDRLPTGVIYLHAIKVPSSGAKVGGKDIKYAALDDKQIGVYAVSMVMNELGSQKWKEMTTENLNKQVAITMDNYVFSAPVVNDIMEQSSSITGNFTMAEAKDLVGLLNAGAFPAPVKIVDESIVGASLGEENTNAGIWSFVLALSLVLAYMVFYYNKAGMIANIALVINVFLLIGALASLKAILTLPGIAGIVLTLGMSVDANVLIFERVKEELRNGKGLKASINEGFSKALASILDSNITTLLTGVVLLIFGSGPIKGFATTLIIGIFTSFFAAIIITRLIISSFAERDKNITFSTRFTKDWFTTTQIKFVKKRKLFYLLSSAVIVMGIASFFTRGLDYGVDFAGGRQYKVVFDQKADYEGIKAELKTQFEGNEPGVKMVDNSFTALITTKYRITETTPEVDSLMEDLLTTGLAKFGEFKVEETKMIAPTISSDLKKNALYAISFSLLIIFLYILFRFRKWQFGLGALISLAHDVLIVLSLFSICYGWIGFSLEIDQAFIAAILTVVGYSINDTVVVFDRIRENLVLFPKKDMKETIDSALNTTLGRTINTSLTTFIVLIVIFIFGGAAIKGFVFALMIGVVVGTYSSICIATPIFIDFTKNKLGAKQNIEKI